VLFLSSSRPRMALVLFLLVFFFRFFLFATKEKIVKDAEGPLSPSPDVLRWIAGWPRGNQLGSSTRMVAPPLQSHVGGRSRFFFFFSSGF